MDLVATLLREDLARDFSCNIVVVYLYLKYWKLHKPYEIPKISPLHYNKSHFIPSMYVDSFRRTLN